MIIGPFSSIAKFDEKLEITEYVDDKLLGRMSVMQMCVRQMCVAGLSALGV